MEYYLNFKNLLAVLLFISIAGLYSCNDSLGIEANVRMTILDSAAKKPVPPKARFTADSTIIQISENFIDKINMDTVYRYPWIMNINYNDIKIDTGSLISYIWAKLDIKNTYGIDSIPGNIKQHVKEIMLILDSIPASGGLSLNGNINSSNWSMLALEDTQYPDSIHTMEGVISPIQLTFYEDIRKPGFGWFKFTLKAVINPTQPTSYFILFTANVYVEYKMP